MTTTTDGFRSITINSSYYKQLPNDIVAIRGTEDDVYFKMDNDNVSYLFSWIRPYKHTIEMSQC